MSQISRNFSRKSVAIFFPSSVTKYTK
jgi:hypothetical protein